MSTPSQGPNVVTSSSPGVPVVGIASNQAGGYVVNPSDAVDQGQTIGSQPAVLYVDQVGSARTQANQTTIALQPGQSYYIIPNSTTSVSVASKIANHKFTAVQWSL